MGTDGAMTHKCASCALCKVVCLSGEEKPKFNQDVCLDVELNLLSGRGRKLLFGVQMVSRPELCLLNTLC